MRDKEQISELFKGTKSSTDDILLIMSRLVAIDSLAKDKLSDLDDIPFLMRAFIAAVLIDNMAKGYELDASSLSNFIGIPRPTVQRWIKHYEALGVISLIKRGNRKVIKLNKLDPRVIEYFDKLASHFSAPK